MTPEISLPKEAKKIYSYDTLTEHMWFWFYKMLFCRQRNNLTTTGRALAYIFIIKKTDNGRCIHIFQLGNIATLKEYQTGEKLTISKKLMKVKNSPVLAMDKDELINKIPLVPRYKNIIHIENGKIRTNTKKDVDNLMKLLNDDYVKSLRKESKVVQTKKQY